VGSLPELLSLLKTGVEVGLLLLDLHISQAFGFTGLAQVSEHYPEVPVMIVSGNNNPNAIYKSGSVIAAQ
jgi:DNA-binding NarL/FixJ family response regulator